MRDQAPSRETLAERLERYAEGGLTLEEQLDEEGIGWGPTGDDGYNPGDPPNWVEGEVNYVDPNG